MKICQEHGKETRRAIVAKGMGAFISKAGEIALENPHVALKGHAETKDFDPLLSVAFAIYRHVLDCCGFYALQRDFCPLCELENNGGKAQVWIDGSTEGALLYCRNNNLILPRKEKEAGSE